MRPRCGRYRRRRRSSPHLRCWMPIVARAGHNVLGCGCRKRRSPLFGVNMQRRKFFALLGGAVLWPRVVQAQKLDRLRRIGVLMPLSSSDPIAGAVFDSFVQGLQKLGWSDGKNISFETRYSEGKPERLPGLAAEMVHANVDVLVVWAA